MANTTLDRTLGLRVVRAERVPRRSPQLSSPPRSPGDAVRPPAHPEVDRLLRRPVFVLSSVRSGSTLLRVILSSHSHLHAPHELHFRRMLVDLTTDPVRQAVAALEETQSDMEHLLWDRLLHRELVRSGKETLVEKTPSNVFVHRRLATCWPDARFVFLLRHPLSIMRSWHEADPDRRPIDVAIHRTYQYMWHLERARHQLPGLELRYEDLTADPERETRRICEFLEVPWEPGMLDYGQAGHGDFVKGIGDWREKIRTGRVQPGRPLPSPDEIPERLRDISKAWGYLD